MPILCGFESGQRLSIYMGLDHSDRAGAINCLWIYWYYKVVFVKPVLRLLSIVGEKRVFFPLFGLSLAAGCVPALAGWLDGAMLLKNIMVPLLVMLHLIRYPLYGLLFASIAMHGYDAKKSGRRLAVVSVVPSCILLIVSVSIPHALPSGEEAELYGACHWVRRHIDVRRLHQWVVGQNLPSRDEMSIPRDRWPEELAEQKILREGHVKISNGILQIRFIGSGMRLDTGGLAIKKGIISPADIAKWPLPNRERRKCYAKNIEEYALVWYCGEPRGDK